jgi:hypothetical protein
MAQHPFVVALRQELIQDGTLIEKARRVCMSSLMTPSFQVQAAAAAVVHGGGANGLTAWKDAAGKTLKELEEAKSLSLAKHWR